MTPDDITITLALLAGTGDPPQWSLIIVQRGSSLVTMSGSSNAVLAALRASIDEIDHARPAVLAGKPETRQ